MKIKKSTGIVLSSQTFGEGDILSNILTRDSGKRKFIFKGLKKSKRRSQTVSEPGSIVKLVYYHRDGRDSSIVNECTLEKHYSEIRGDLEKIFHLSYMVEVVERTMGYEINDVPTYELLLAGIETLTKTDRPLLCSAFFLIHLLRIHGILTDFSLCKICGNKSSRYTLDIDNLQTICEKCGPLSSRTIKTGAASSVKRKATFLNNEITEFVTLTQRVKFNKLSPEKYNRERVLDLIYFISLFLENYYHMRLKSKDFVLSENI